ncbi:MAG TPA: FG-GAP repeat protein [Povalibacter sp.]
MRRLSRVSWLRFVAAFLLLAAASSQAQFVTPLQSIATFPGYLGCVAFRCFARVVADGDTAIILNTGTGVMVRSAPGVWNVQQELWNPAGRPSALTPMSAPAGLSGDVLLLTGTSRVYNNVPVIYVWQRTGTTWAHTQVLALPRPPGFNSMSVKSVKLSQKTAAVCTLHGDTAGGSRAQIDIFTLKSDGRFLRQAQIIPSITLNTDFPCQLVLEGNTLLVQDPAADQASGRVLVYESGSKGWVLRHRLTASDGTAGAQFGASAGISGNTIVVGAPQRPNFDQPLHLGAAYVFQRTATSWAQMQLLVKPEFTSDEAPPEEFNTAFGYTVSISGDRLSVSSTPSPPAYVYERRGVWAPVAGLHEETRANGAVGQLSGSIAVQEATDGHSGAWGVAYELPPLWTLPPRVDP